MTAEIDGALAGALANAQAAFPTISRDKEVTVKTKTGGEYKFKYAPLDSILNAVRKPLADNGLAIAQLLDDGELVTMLMHKDGGRLSGRVALPNADGVQALGSAITYLRRYSIQAILGIAAEEDDDGNHASGNQATFNTRREPPRLPPREDPRTGADGLIGRAIAQGTQDFELRQSPDGWSLPFRVKDGTKSFIVLAENDLAQSLSTIKATVINQRVTVWGRWTTETIPAKGDKPEVRYQVLHLERIATPDGILPAPVGDTPMPNDEPPLEEPPEDLPLFGEEPAA